MKKKIIIISLLLTTIGITTIVLAQSTGNKTTQSKKKFIYSRLYYNYLWDKAGTSNKHEYFAQGVPQEISNKISAMNLTDAMNFMGADGWELVSAYTDEISLGTQYAYIFKKEAY
jgi:hypothetical protein